MALQRVDLEAGTLYVDRQVTQDGENEKARTTRQKAITKGRGRAHCIRHMKWRDLDEGRAVPLPASIAARISDHVRHYGAYSVKQGPNRLAGTEQWSNLVDLISVIGSPRPAAGAHRCGR
ncbi:hypothetical protein [Streptomyces sp. NPDC058872]|uniref:hypothetical protein n=1 Tax=Streptomyces sp. NPDC058872 TaxID=3346661 RepID=UPI0036B01897